MQSCNNLFNRRNIQAQVYLAGQTSYQDASPTRIYVYSCLAGISCRCRPMNRDGPQLTINTHLNPFDPYSYTGFTEYQHISRFVSLPRACPVGGGGISKSEDGTRCVVAGKDSLKILRISSPSQPQKSDHKSAIGEGGYRIDASRNLWDGSTLKIDSATTDIVWGHGLFNNKILTSARNGELIMWDLNRTGPSKYERRSKDHTRSINKLSVSKIVHHYCITGSADGDLRVWDLRDMTKSIMRVHHPTSVRSLVFSPSAWQPLQAVVGLDNGSIYRWDLKMGQRGQLDRLHVAHSASVTALDWCPVGGVNISTGLAREDLPGSGLGWIVSGGLDRTVKVWDLTPPGSNSHIPPKATYVLHPSFPVRRVAWRPEYQCELAIVSNAEFSSAESQQSPGINFSVARTGSLVGFDHLPRGPSSLDLAKERLGSVETASSNVIEIWDVRRGWIAKWSVCGSGGDGGVSDIVFSGSDAVWAQHTSGTFTQFDLRETSKPIDAIPRTALSWEATGSISFVVDRKDIWEIPHDDGRLNFGTTVLTEVGKSTPKVLGDPVARVTQIVANYSDGIVCGNLEVFTKLARGYIYEGKRREEICEYNSGIALSAGNELGAQVWLLLGASIANHDPTGLQNQNTRNASASTKGTAEETPQPTEHSLLLSPGRRTPSIIAPHTRSPGRTSVSGSLTRLSRPGSGSVSRRLTPASSTSASPLHLSVSLPPILSRRAPSFRRESGERPSASRTPSGSISLFTNAGSSDRSTPSLRHVGEGVLDDSDSSSGGSEGDSKDTADGYSSEEDSIPKLRPMGPLGHGGFNHSGTPSSWIGRGRPWRETEDETIKTDYGDDEDDEDEDEDEDISSTSPRSTSDTETDWHGLTLNRRPSMSHSRSHSSLRKQSRRTSDAGKSRSRSSTIATPLIPMRPKPLTHQESRSSIRTVTAAESMLPVPMPPDLLSAMKMGSVDGNGIDKGFEGMGNPVTERRMDLIREEDARYREITLTTLKKIVEVFAEEGDVQMCAMLSLIAAQELDISKTRAGRFLDSYLEILTRLRLHTCAAYIRKSCEIEDIRSMTLVGTTVYTTCGKCRKPLMVPIGSSKVSELRRGRYAYCSTCRAPCVRCSICRLPVQTLLFQCSVCHHGGHQTCYRDYYLRYPMVELPVTTPLLPSVGTGGGVSGSDDDDIILRGQVEPKPVSFTPSVGGGGGSGFIDDDSASTVSVQSSSGAVAGTLLMPVESPEVGRITSKLKGHPCASGCGHFCWAASGGVNDDF